MGKTLGKLRSGRGASLLVALLLFLICSVIGIVVLTASTAVSGRASKLAENDQRYFSVASAAELLAQELSGQTVTVVRTETTGEQTTTIYSINTETGESSEVTNSGPYANDGPTGEEPKVPDFTASLQKLVASDSGSDLVAVLTPVSGYTPGGSGYMTDMTLSLLYGNPDTANLKYELVDGEAGYQLKFGDGVPATGPLMGKFELSLDTTLSTGADPDSLKVECSYSLQKNGMLTITVSNQAEDADTDVFSLVLTLQADIRETVKPDEITISEQSESVSESWYTYTDVLKTITTKTKTSTVTWKLIGIAEKSDVAPTPTPAGNS